MPITDPRHPSIVVTDSHIVSARGSVEHPPGLDLDALLARTHPGAVIVVTRQAGDTLGIRPVRHGWAARRGPDGAERIVGTLANLDRQESPLVPRGGWDRPERVAWVMDRWREQTGVPWRGPMLTAERLMTDTLPPARHNRFTFSRRLTDPLEGTGHEGVLTPRSWSRERDEDDPPGTVTVDGTRRYLAAMSSVLLARGQLEHSRRPEFDHRRAGWWRVDVPEDAPDPRLPHPGGPDGGGTRWITTPTARLLTERYGTLIVHEAWTGEGVRLLRPFAQRVDEVWTAAHALAETPDIGPWWAGIGQAAKSLYKRLYGALKSEAFVPYRPDWHAAITAQARCTVWRHMATAADDGYYPLRVDTDAVTYPGDRIPPNYRLGDGLGRWHAHTPRKAVTA